MTRSARTCGQKKKFEEGLITLSEKVDPFSVSGCAQIWGTGNKENHKSKVEQASVEQKKNGERKHKVFSH